MVLNVEEVLFKCQHWPINIKSWDKLHCLFWQSCHNKEKEGLDILNPDFSEAIRPVYLVSLQHEWQLGRMTAFPQLAAIFGQI